jgi:hypothetical protein
VTSHIFATNIPIIYWAFLEEPVANLTRELTTNNLENQQCSYETKKFYLKLL